MAHHVLLDLYKLHTLPRVTDEEQSWGKIHHMLNLQFQKQFYSTTFGVCADALVQGWVDLVT